MFVDANHKGARPSAWLVALVSDIESQGDGIILSGLACGEVVEGDMTLEPIGRGLG